MAAPLDNDIHTVHILRFGVAVCGRPGLPYSWPMGHGWIRYDAKPSPEEKRKLCGKCRLKNATEVTK